MESVLCDIRYAMDQVKRCLHPINGGLMDSAQRALDALERAEAIVARSIEEVRDER